jgi:outer membrane protein assembly factor BamB
MSKTRAAVALLGLLAVSRLVAGDDWFNWRGPARNGVSKETGLVSTWSKKTGENLVWRDDFTGRSTPIVFQGRVCANGRVGTGPLRQEIVACWDAGTGKRLWERRFEVYNTTVPFTRVGWAAIAGDPETGNVYAQNVDGQVVCLDKTGKTVWERRLGEEFGRGSGFGGRTLIPLVDEDRLVVGVVGAGWGDIGPPRQRYIAFDKKTGAVRWVSTPATGPFDDANNQSSPTVGVLGGERLVLGGGADGWLYAMRARTGELKWRFQVSQRGLNSPVVTVGDMVVAAHGEENADGGSMGRAVLIDGTGTGEVTKTHERWRSGDLLISFAGPTVKDGRVYLLDISANLHALDEKTGKPLWSQSLGTMGRAAPVWADGKLYLTEVNGKVLIVEPGPTGAKVLSEVELDVAEGRPAEIWGSVAPAYGRLYFTTEEGIYCLGKKGAPFRPVDSKPAPSTEPSPAPDAKSARLQIVPAEVIGKAGEAVTFEAWAFDDHGRFLRKEKATWTLDGLPGEISPEGVLKTPVASTAAGKVKAVVGELNATTQVRLFGPLPWTFDFESGAAPRWWIGAGPRFKVTEADGGKRLTKPPVETGLNRSSVYIGPATMSGYTVEADLMGTRQGRRMPDLGIIDQGYTLDLMGKHQKVQLRTWASELEKSANVDFPWEPDVWYHMKLRVDPGTGKEKGVARGKVWKKGEAEPADWTITLEDPIPVRAGSPGIYGDSVTDIHWDNLTVKVSE